MAYFGDGSTEDVVNKSSGLSGTFLRTAELSLLYAADWRTNYKSKLKGKNLRIDYLPNSTKRCSTLLVCVLKSLAEK
ncbi:hypothetical protein LWI28_002807 [Acer negundo]|uniref:Uncharacterized protein n=1 Tax=Acer negundo TaxID=4023 RepID=A0AAD5NGV4_ACENE|nr:hypothetical protein LWI28_002807 [Acer negundo]KAK4838600.1 hypothetical protein QYF36_014994 [Acer negundo]